MTDPHIYVCTVPPYIYPAVEVGYGLHGEETSLRIYSSRWCMNHADEKAWNQHSVYKGVQILRGYNDLAMTRASKIYRAVVESTAEREVVLYGESLDIIRLMVTRWVEGRLKREVSE